MTRADTDVTVEVTDDGTGCGTGCGTARPPRRRREGGSGLAGLAEWVTALDGSLTAGPAHPSGVDGACGGAGVIRVLIADDQEMVRHNLRRILETAPDLRVVGEADGDAAVELARVLRPDVVLADIRMPRRDGLAVPANSPDRRQQPTRCGSSSITTFDLDEYVYAALRNGACGCSAT